MRIVRKDRVWCLVLDGEGFSLVREVRDRDEIGLDGSSTKPVIAVYNTRMEPVDLPVGRLPERVFVQQERIFVQQTCAVSLRVVVSFRVVVSLRVIVSLRIAVSRRVQFESNLTRAVSHR